MTYARAAGLIALLMLLTGCFSTKSSMTEYVPIERTVYGNQIKLTPRPDWKTNEHMARIQSVFKTYEVKYKVKDGQILIKNDLAADWGTLAEYSMKANDPDWNKKPVKRQQVQPSMQPQPKLNSGWSIQSGGR